MANRGNLINTIKVIQHNVLKWTFAKWNEFSNIYMRHNPEVILLNSTGVNENSIIKIFQYNVYQRNVRNEGHAGIAIAVRRDVQHRLLDDFQEDMLAVRLEAGKGPVIISTTYRPFRQEFLPVEDLLKLGRMRDPAYLLADLNARHRLIGHSGNNDAGQTLFNMIRGNLFHHMGPDFNTRVGNSGISRPDIILRNSSVFFNYAMIEGELTTSDHIPVLFKISTAPIMKANTPRKL